jgi:DnaJ-class molecular chaperone
MGLNGNRFKLSPQSIPCPTCHGYPRLVVIEYRHVPQCDTCGGQGSVPRAKSASGSLSLASG